VSETNAITEIILHAANGKQLPG